MNALIWIWAAVSFSAILSAAGFIYLSRALSLNREEYERSSQAAAERIEALSKELGEGRRRLADCEERYSPVAEGGFSSASLHLNRRGQVAQLFRRGQSSRSIASALGISQGEVKLIIKMLDLDGASESTGRKANPTRKHGESFDKASGVNAGEA